MTAVCFYFQIHQPYRLKNYSFVHIGLDHKYDAVDKNFTILSRVADKCYLPTNELLLNLIEKTGKAFKVTFSISGVALEQFQEYRPDVIESFRQLAKTGCVEFLAETYYHSLAFLYSKEEFERQVKMHSDLVKKLFGKKPVAFRNTELVYSNAVAAAAEKLGFKTIMAEAVPAYLKGAPQTGIYRPEGTKKIKAMLRHRDLSDDIAFRFCDKNWSEYPLLAPRFASWLDKMAPEAEAINICLDYETFGEHRHAETGIFQFLTYLPQQILNYSNLKFATVSEAAADAPATAVYDVPEFTTWADEARDLSGWTENHMQKDALARVSRLERKILKLNDAELCQMWGKLQTSDHFYYMSTRYWDDGVRQQFSPFKSPYDAYIVYMNVLSDFEQLVNSRLAEMTAEPVATTAATASSPAQK